MKTITKPPNKGQRKQVWLDRHYDNCERLARYVGVSNPIGKKISTALVQLEYIAHRGATAYCNGEDFTCFLRGAGNVAFKFNSDETAWHEFTQCVKARVLTVFDSRSLPGFFVNGDARGYALKIDTDAAKKLLGKDAITRWDALYNSLHRDWGGYVILSPEYSA